MLIRREYVYFYCIPPPPPPLLRRFYFLSKNLENYGLKCQKIAGHVKDISVFFFREVTQTPIGASGLRPLHCSELPSAADDSSMGAPPPFPPGGWDPSHVFRIIIACISYR